MKIKLICIDKKKSKTIDSEIKNYHSRINAFINFSVIYFKNDFLSPNYKIILL